MMDKVFIDTDVILDFLFDRQPFSEDAAHILNLCESGRIEGFVTSVMLSNIYFILRKTAKHAKVIKSLKKLITIVNVAITSKETVMTALNSEFRDFEDALQNYSAQNEKNIKILITRNVKDYKTSELSIMTPETFLRSF